MEKNEQPSDPTQKKKTTGLLPDFFYKDMVSKPLEDIQNLRVPPSNIITLYIYGIGQEINLTEQPFVKLGRFDETTRNENEQVFDLSDFRAGERGVSRNHCQISLHDSHLSITDLGSTNGTFINGKRLLPYKAYMLKKGDELALGRLSIQIMT